MTELDMKDSPEGLLLPVIARPKGGRNAIAGIHDGALKVSVTPPPEKGKANEAIAKVIGELLEVAPSRVTLKSGETSRRKLFVIEGITVDTAIYILVAKGVIVPDD
jgi:uncharacterized protein (TIGR00251 family)